MATACKCNKLVQSIMDTSGLKFINSMKIDYLTNLIDKKYMNLKKTCSSYTDYVNVTPVVEEKVRNASTEINSYVFSEIIDHLPESSIANITPLIEGLESLHKSEDDEWGHRSIRTSFNFYMTDAASSSGTLTIYFELKDFDEFGILDVHDVIEVKMDNVIYKNYSYYYITNDLIKWLSVEDKPKRKKALDMLFY